MERVLVVPPLGRIAKLADAIMMPFMWCAMGMGTLRESSQRTHVWNNVRLQWHQINHLDEHLMVRCDDICHAAPFRPILFHIPILASGWKEYVVIRPRDEVRWHVGWIARHAIGVSRLILAGPARLLLPPSPVQFFGIGLGDYQIQVEEVGRGRLGDNGSFRHLPLL